MAGIPGWVYAQLGQDVVIEAYGGVVGGAESYAAPTTVRAVVEESEETDRSENPTGDTLVKATFRCALGTACPAGSRVTLASGMVGTVTASKRWDGGRTNAPSHLEVTMMGNVRV